MQIWYLRVIIYRSAQSCASCLTCLKATAHLSSLTERCTSSLLRFQCRHLGMLYSVPLCESPPPLPAPPGCHRDILYQIAKPEERSWKAWLPLSLTLVVIKLMRFRFFIISQQCLIYLFIPPKELGNILTFNIVNRLKISATGNNI